MTTLAESTVHMANCSNCRKTFSKHFVDQMMDNKIIKLVRDTNTITKQSYTKWSKFT